MNYDFILSLSKQDIAGILTCCGYAMREDISLLKALEEMGFDINVAGVKDFCTQQELCHLGSFCLTQLTYE
ncbi:MAG: hypothetical protein PUP92_34405 [Rhizonema sp. PD38]|nr:hypothetical protein [Rhizonema sp. PD38]